MTLMCEVAGQVMLGDGVMRVRMQDYGRGAAGPNCHRSLAWLGFALGCGVSSVKRHLMLLHVQYKP